MLCPFIVFIINWITGYALNVLAFLGFRFASNGFKVLNVWERRKILQYTVDFTAVKV